MRGEYSPASRRHRGPAVRTRRGGPVTGWQRPPSRTSRERIPVTLLMPASPQPRAIPFAPSGDFAQVLAVVDLDAPVEPVIRRAVAESSAHGVPLQVIVLHPRLPFTTDPALVARIARRRGHEQRRVVAAVADAAQGSGLSEIEVRVVPLSRIPLMSRSGKARRTVTAELRRQPSSLRVAAEHPARGAGANPAAPEPRPSVGLQHSRGAAADA
jgi:hypothetical protein